MMPERDRLASDPFQVGYLRSDIGVAVLRDLMALWQKSSEVEYRPGLGPEKCSCRANDSKTNGRSRDWKHIYRCHKDNHPDSELCFLCNKWFTVPEAWDNHCAEHLQDLSTFPVYRDPLVYGGALATPGYCPFCLTDVRRRPGVRIYQFLNRSKWLDHIHRHIQHLDGSQPVECPHPHPSCTGFESVQKLRFHLHDAHGIRGFENSTESKRPRESDDGTHQRKWQPSLKKEKQDEVSIGMDYSFVNVATENLGSCKKRKVKSPDSPADEKAPEIGLPSPPSSDAEPIEPAILQEDQTGSPKLLRQLRLKVRIDVNGPEYQSDQDRFERARQPARGPRVFAIP